MKEYTQNKEMKDALNFLKDSLEIENKLFAHNIGIFDKNVEEFKFNIEIKLKENQKLEIKNLFENMNGKYYYKVDGHLVNKFTKFLLENIEEIKLNNKKLIYLIIHLLVNIEKNIFDDYIKEVIENILKLV
uniref:Uncharacterized protein n=1 Tax=Meloidogyne enterolobii TaxID=390850 RepID=A0A6V7UN34_MELEN|nr:unnamed protein product [Meloidogyne enterolobii]